MILFLSSRKPKKTIIYNSFISKIRVLTAKENLSSCCALVVFDCFFVALSLEVVQYILSFQLFYLIDYTISAYLKERDKVQYMP